MSAAEFSPAAIPHSCTLQRVPSVLWAPGHSSTNAQQAAAACPQGRGRGALQLCAHPCRYSGACCDSGACFGSPLGPASAQAVLSPPFAALLASRVNHVLMLSPRSAEGAATLDPINKYTFHTALKPVIPLCMEGPTRDLVLIRGMLRAALPSACPASAAQGGPLMMLPAQPPAAAAPQPSRNRRWGGSVCPRPPPCCCGGASGISSHNHGPGPTAPWPWLPSCRRAAACQVAACCRGKGDLFLNSWLKSWLHLQQKGEAAALLRGCGQRSGRAASGAALCRQRCPAWKGPSGSLAPRESC